MGTCAQGRSWACGWLCWGWSGWELPIRWALTDPRRQTLWGHPAPASWFNEGSAFSGVAPCAPVLEARPIVAM